MDVVKQPPIRLTEIDWNTSVLSSPSPLWALVDGVNWPEIQAVLAEYLPPHACLYTTTDPGTQRTAPWLVRVEAGTPMQSLFELQDPNNHGVIYFHSQRGLKQLRDHFRRYTLLMTPANPDMPVYFRFYDPRVLLDMMSALDEYKLAQFFVGIERFFIPKSYPIGLPTYTDVLPLPLDQTTQVTDACLAIELNQPDAQLIQATQGFKVNDQEFQQFNQLMAQRRPLNLALKLYRLYADHFTAAHYEYASQLSYQTGAHFSLKSEREQLLLADCYLWLGRDFLSHKPEAKSLLLAKHPNRFFHLQTWLNEQKQRIATSALS